MGVGGARWSRAGTSDIKVSNIFQTSHICDVSKRKKALHGTLSVIMGHHITPSSASQHAADLLAVHTSVHQYRAVTRGGDVLQLWLKIFPIAGLSTQCKENHDRDGMAFFFFLIHKHNLLKCFPLCFILCSQLSLSRVSQWLSGAAVTYC